MKALTFENNFSMVHPTRKCRNPFSILLGGASAHSVEYC